MTHPYQPLHLTIKNGLAKNYIRTQLITYNMQYAVKGQLDCGMVHEDIEVNL